MNVLFLMQTYIDVNIADAMFNSLVSEFVKNGNQVTIVASNQGKEKTNIRKEGDGEVLRVKTLPILNVNPIFKAFASLLLSFQYRLAIKKYLPNRHFDLIITPTPPITLTKLAKGLKKKNNAKVFLILRDIFPQNAVDLGLITRHNISYFIFRSMEKELYKIADAIGCMTEGNKKYLIEKNPEIEQQKVHLLPNWSAISSFPEFFDSGIIEKYDLKNKFILIFGGNLGIAQKVENIIEFSKIHQDKKDLLILVIGQGTHKNHLIKLIEKDNIQNVRVLDYMRRPDYEALVSISDVGFISLNENFTIPNIPYRTLSYYNFKKPVFAIVDPATDYGRMLEEDNSGFCCLYGDYDSYKNLFDRLYYDSELRNQMGSNGYNSLIEKYNTSKAYQRIAQIMSFK